MYEALPARPLHFGIHLHGLERGRGGLPVGGTERLVALRALHRDATPCAPSGARLPRRLRAVLHWSPKIRRTEGATRDLYFGGTSQLTSLWMDLEKVHSLLEFLEQQAHVMTLLEDAGDGTSVRIGAEVGTEVDDVAMVATTYDAGDCGRGRVGVLGPKRMNYRRTIKVVEEVGDGLADSLGG